MAAAMPLTPAARLWRADGVAATLIEVRSGAIYARIDGERDPVVAEEHLWMFALTCGYCTWPAEVQLIDGQPEDVLCKRCAGQQFDRPADWVRPIPKAVIQQLVDRYKPRPVNAEPLGSLEEADHGGR